MELIEPVQSSATNEVCQEFIAAIHHGDLTTAKKLIANQADLVNLVDGESDKTAFELALAGGMSSFARFLINTEPFDVNHEDHHPLRIAIDLGYLDLAANLLEKGSNPNYRPKHISSSLLLCLEKEYFELAELMVEYGAEVDIRNDKGWTPLIWAAIKGRKPAVEFLLKHGANIHLCNNDGWNAITGAYFKKRLDIVDILKNAGAVFGANYSEAALLSAYNNGYLDIVNALLDQGVNPNICDDNGESLVIKAAVNGHHELLRKLIECNADVNCRDSNKMPLVAILAKQGHADLVKLVLDSGGDVNLAGSQGVTGLYQAACFNNVATVKLLTKRGANLNAQTKERGLTPLMIAAANGYQDVVTTLYTAGANSQLVTKKEQTAKAFARHFAPRVNDNPNGLLRECAHKEILELLTLPGHFIDAD